MRQMSPSAGPSRVLDLGLALGLGGFAALMVVVLPPLFAVAVAALVALLAVVSRVDVRAMADALLLLTSFLIPMNRLYLGSSGFPMADFVLLAATGLYILIRLLSQERHEERTYRTTVIGLSVIAVGAFIGSLFEVPGPFIYEPTGLEPLDVSGWGHNLGNLGKFLLASMIPLLTFALARPNREFIRRIVGAFLLGCVVSAFLGVAFPWGHPGGRAIGATVHPNQFGSLSLLAMGPALAFLLAQRRVRAWAWFVLPLLAYGILASGSRAALGGVIVLAAIVGPLTRSRVVMGTLLLGVAILTLVFATGLVQAEGDNNALGRAFGDSPTAAGSDSKRDDLHEEVLDRWRQRPLTGNGFNYMRPSHNVYLGIIASAGVLGVVGFTYFFSGVLRRVWRRRTDLFFVAITAAYLAYAAQAFFDNVFWWRWLWFYVSMVIATSVTDPEPGEPGYDDLVAATDEAGPDRWAAAPAASSS